MMRLVCDTCKRPESACYCKNISLQSNSTPTTILIHPDEVDHPLGTAKMAALSFTNIELLEGVEFETNSTLRDKIEKHQSFILYPCEDAIELSALSAPPCIEHLIVVDGSWRKAKRIIAHNHFLNTLPKLKLPAEQNSIYELRKAPKSNQLSTIEAITQALNFIEKKDYNSVLDVLKKQIKLHKKFIKKE